MGSNFIKCCEKRSKPLIESKLNDRLNESIDSSQGTNLNNGSKRSMHIFVNKSIFIMQENGTPDDNYILSKTLGEGAYGVVIKATHKLTNAIRAIKSIKKSGRLSDLEITNEINMLSMIDHPNIIKIFEFYKTKDRYYIVTEYCQGGELFQKIISAAPLEENLAALIMYQLFSAVHYCHKIGLIHRDLKPENILLTGNELNPMIKIIDFGTAKIFDKAKNERHVIGSSYYMAPEVWNKDYNEKCDLWSCGIILYILLTGEPPFNGQDDKEIMNNIRTGIYDMNRSNITKCSFEVKDLITRLLVKNPKFRISAEECISHQWFKKFDTKNKINHLPEKIIRRLIENIHSYNPSCILKQAALGFLVHNCPEMEDIIDASKLFNKIDINGDGMIIKQELFEGLNKMLNDSSSLSDDVDKIFKILDSDCNGYLEYGEFVRAAIDRKIFLNNTYLKFAFSHFDINKDDSIMLKEIREVFGKYCRDIEDFEKVIHEVDLNGDGYISFSEFEIMMNNILK
jgi:calcium-dependent protein kinase